MKYQTRSEKNGIQQHDSFFNALLAAMNDPSIWKISYSLPEGKRIRLIKNERGNWELEDILANEVL